MSSLNLLILLLSISVHACNSRCLSNIVKEIGKQGHLFTEDVNKANLYKSVTQLWPQGEQEVENKQKKVHENWDGENTMKTEESKAFLKEETSKRATSGNNILPSQLEAKPERVNKRQGRWMLESSRHDTDEAVNNKENEVVEDVVVMDYAQPHRKPPIHNEKP
ncbi:hypothetical protein Patl1_18515 [Pistacia atlantica]|uniref:Uncharacterized protein n=2 Tax=Pistacia atlantica TaxID=434234 RepID=A0ACC1BZD9_9ROSI|nr:hypothetical protein Patl1_18518 [Pistacia atlantica]KAJ0105109.1 hypothetical protein Patl1_18515 [Pistacia atlantica]